MKTVITSIAIAATLTLALPVWADKHGMKGHGEHMDHDMMGDKQGMQQMRHVSGHGVVNKVMGDHHMVNITHEPIEAMNWPKMRMNFSTAEDIVLKGLEKGDTVQFTMEVDEEGNYRIVEINKK